MHCIIERMEYLFPPLSYLTHHSALSGLLNLSQTLLVSLVRDLTLMPWWPVLPGVDVRCKIFLPGQACVVLKRLVHAWARQSINVPSINPCINYLMLISIHVAVSLVAAQVCMKSSHNPRPGKRCSGRKPNWPYISLVDTYTCLACAIHIDPSNTLLPCSLSMWHAPP